MVKDFQGVDYWSGLGVGIFDGSYVKATSIMRERQANNRKPSGKAMRAIPQRSILRSMVMACQLSLKSPAEKSMTAP